MRTWIFALIALIVGGAIGYAYKQGEANQLMEQVSALEAKVTEATAAAATQIEEMKAELEAKTQLADEQQAEISELEAALKSATSAATAPQPAPPVPTPSPDSPTTSPAQ